MNSDDDELYFCTLQVETAFAVPYPGKSEESTSLNHPTDRNGRRKVCKWRHLSQKNGNSINKKMTKELTLQFRQCV